MRRMVAAALFGVALWGCGGGGAGRTIDVDKAEREANAATVRMGPYCRSLGEAAEGWAEINTQNKSGYEIIAQCAGKLP